MGRKKRRRNEPPQLVFLNSPYTKRAPPSPVLATDRQPAVGRREQPDSRWIQHDFPFADGGQPSSFVGGVGSRAGLSFSHRRRKLQQQSRRCDLSSSSAAAVASRSSSSTSSRTVVAKSSSSSVVASVAAPQAASCSPVAAPSGKADVGMGGSNGLFRLLPPRTPPPYQPGRLLLPATPPSSPPPPPERSG